MKMTRRGGGRQSRRRIRQKSISSQGSDFRKSKPSLETVLNEFTRSNTLAGGVPRCEDDDFRFEKHELVEDQRPATESSQEGERRYA